MEKSFYLDSIAKLNQQPIVIYVAIGCAAHRIENVENNMWRLPETNNQEYPLFLQILKSKYPNINLHIFMIDPSLEDIPFVITTGDKHTLKNNWHRINSEMFYNHEENTTIYAIKDNFVYPYDKWQEDKKYNIFLEKLNNFAKRENWTVFFCDFTGKRVRETAIYFKEEIKNHENHIIYGFLTDDENISSCSIDTTSPECLFVSSNINNRIEIFNPYMYEKNYWVDLPNYLHNLKKNNSDSDLIIASIQIKNFLREKKREIKDILYSLRAVYIGIQKKETINDYNVFRTNMLADKYNFKFYDHFDEHGFQIMFNNIKNIFLEEIEKYAKIIYLNDTNDLVNNIYFTMMKDNNVYNWETYLKVILIDYDILF